MTEQNPKLAGSNIVDCIPQTGECPHKCSECFYNGGRFYRTLEEPLIPTVEEVAGRIVRVNCGNDSNNKREQVIRETARYRDKFYNTSIPKLDFPAPVVLTLNPQHGDKLWLVDPVPPNLMFVRVRAGLWESHAVTEAAAWYNEKRRDVPVVATFMRYYDIEKIPIGYRDFYEHRKNISNSYWMPKTQAVLDFMAKFKFTGVKMCGTPWSSLCVDCGNCEAFYWRAIRRMAVAMQPAPK